MLILSRKLDEQILIGDGIIITVVSIRGGKVRIGIEAPPDVSIHRQEVLHSPAEERDAERSEAEAQGADGRSGPNSVS